ncbi:F-box/kelch-repeat protein [Abeliophyllum distichum]|uniref:F-box/kelch-repeat protein n=1 Tax=Abeliophyllum distichum TaxID=126358 RepID=A0ABD1UHZ0_9LAMI
MSDYLPQEVWIDIFTRLPVKTLLRIRSVCKFFDCIITRSSFISNHITSTKHTHIPLVRFLTGKKRIERKEHYLLLTSDMDNMQELDFPFKSKSFKHFQIVGSCDGLFCLSDSKDYGLSLGHSAYGIILWNPSIKKYLSLPKPRVTLRTHGDFNFVLGFGFDCKTDDYKVVRIAFLNGKNIPPEVELYTVKSESWRNFNAASPPYMIWGSSHAFVDGSVHWVGYSTQNEKENSRRSVIVTFDMSNEVFREVNLPHDLEEWGTELSMAVVGKKLAVVQYYSWRRQSFSVWVMEEYGMVGSWREMNSVHMNGRYMKFVGFTNNGDILVEIDSGKLVLYDPNDLMYAHVGVRGAKDSFHMETYMESLVLLNGESATLQSEAITCEGEAW